jgi:hypothetical protein
MAYAPSGEVGSPFQSRRYELEAARRAAGIGNEGPPRGAAPPTSGQITRYRPADPGSVETLEGITRQYSPYGPPPSEERTYYSDAPRPRVLLTARDVSIAAVAGAIAIALLIVQRPRYARAADAADSPLQTGVVLRAGAFVALVTGVASILTRVIVSS